MKTEKTISVKTIEEYNNIVKALKKMTYFHAENIRLVPVCGKGFLEKHGVRAEIIRDKRVYEGAFTEVKFNQKIKQAHAWMSRFMDTESEESYRRWLAEEYFELAVRFDFELTKKGENALDDLKVLQGKATKCTILANEDAILDVCLKGRVSAYEEMPRAYKYRYYYTVGKVQDGTIIWMRHSCTPGQKEYSI